MTKKENVVILEADGIRREFEINHAERILRMPNNGGWKLPSDSIYIMDKNNGLIIKRSKGTAEKPE